MRVEERVTTTSLSLFYTSATSLIKTLHVLLLHLLSRINTNQAIIAVVTGK